ncbi:MAG: DNA-3-methyladenine glycosylase 2 family protein, partial [Ostreibacterium sp.]
MTKQSLIRSEAILQQQVEQLISLESRFSLVYELNGLPTLRIRDGGFIHLYRTIVSQQLSVAAASSIWQKLTEANIISQTDVLKSTVEDLSQSGLSKQKIRYVKSLAAHAINYHHLPQQSDDEVISLKTEVTGIGGWTA